MKKNSKNQKKNKNATMSSINFALIKKAAAGSKKRIALKERGTNLTTTTPVVKKKKEQFLNTPGQSRDTFHSMDIFKTDSPSKVFIDGIPYSLDELVCEIQNLKKKKEKLVCRTVLSLVHTRPNTTNSVPHHQPPRVLCLMRRS